MPRCRAKYARPHPIPAGSRLLLENPSQMVTLRTLGWMLALLLIANHAYAGANHAYAGPLAAGPIEEIQELRAELVVKEGRKSFLGFIVTAQKTVDVSTGEVLAKNGYVMRLTCESHPRDLDSKCHAEGQRARVISFDVSDDLSAALVLENRWGWHRLNFTSRSRDARPPDANHGCATAGTMVYTDVRVAEASGTVMGRPVATSHASEIIGGTFIRESVCL